jgi:hypothetical protein
MMLRTLLAALAALTLFMAPVRAGDETPAPFGLRWGMSKSDFLAAGGTVMAETKGPLGLQAAVANLPKALSDLGTIILLFGPNDTLWRVYARSSKWEHDDTGFKVKTRFSELRETLSARYGKPHDYFLEPSDEYYRAPDKFAYSLSQKKRTHASMWELKDLEISLEAESDYETTSYVITYEYNPLGDPIRKGAAAKEKEAL